VGPVPGPDLIHGLGRIPGPDRGHGQGDLGPSHAGPEAAVVVERKRIQSLAPGQEAAVDQRRNQNLVLGVAARDQNLGLSLGGMDQSLGLDQSLHVIQRDLQVDPRDLQAEITVKKGMPRRRKVQSRGRRRL